MGENKGRLIKIAGAIVIAGIVAFAVISGAIMPKAALLSEALEITDGSRVIVTANVADDTFAVTDGGFTFDLVDPLNDPEEKYILPVSCTGAVPIVFGDGVRIMCTGVINDKGVLVCTDLSFNSPAKHESTAGASTVAKLLSGSEGSSGKPVKVTGIVQEGTLAGVDADTRFAIADEAAGTAAPAQLKVRYAGPLFDKMSAGSRVVLTGSLSSDGIFDATDVALEE